MNIFNRTLMTTLAAMGMAAAPAHANDSGDTKYPVVLVHGMAGFDNILGYDYFYGIKSALANVGTDDIYTPQVTGWDTNANRGVELLTYIEDLLAMTNAEKVNLIGHSQGGPTARYVASIKPELVASVTSIGSPHFGSETADLVDSVPDFLHGPVAAIVNAFGDLMAAISGGPGQNSNSLGLLESMSTAGAAAFNADYSEALREGACQVTPVYNANTGWLGWLFPNWVHDYSVNDGDHVVNGVRYYSWSGIYNPATQSNIFDISDYVLGLTHATHSQSNDGLVARCSSHMGQVIRDDYIMTHADEVNWLFGLRGIGATNPVPLYVQHVKRLKNNGL